MKRDPPVCHLYVNGNVTRTPQRARAHSLLLGQAHLPLVMLNYNIFYISFSVLQIYVSTASGNRYFLWDQTFVYITRPVWRQGSVCVLCDSIYLPFSFFGSCIDMQVTCPTIHPFQVQNSMVSNIFTELYNHPHIHFQNIFINSQRDTLYLLAIPTIPPNPTSPCQALVSFLSLQICPSWTFHLKRITQHAVLCGWLLSF